MPDEVDPFQMIPGHPGYRAGRDGSIWSCWTFRGGGYAGQPEWYQSPKWKKLKPCPRKEDGRARYRLKSADGTFLCRYGSFFVLLAFVGPRPSGLEACHNDGNCLNDSISNLRWDTPESNLADKRRHGSVLMGDDHPRSKLKSFQVVEIRKLRASGMSHPDIAKKFGVTPALICFISKRKGWKHVA